MKELTAKQVEEVSGGNPVVVMLLVVAGRAAIRIGAPIIKKTLIGVAGYLGHDEGLRGS